MTLRRFFVLSRFDSYAIIFVHLRELIARCLKERREIIPEMISNNFASFHHPTSGKKNSLEKILFITWWKIFFGDMFLSIKKTKYQMKLNWIRAIFRSILLLLQDSIELIFVFFSITGTSFFYQLSHSCIVKICESCEIFDGLNFFFNILLHSTKTIRQVPSFANYRPTGHAHVNALSNFSPQLKQ